MPFPPMARQSDRSSSTLFCEQFRPIFWISEHAGQAAFLIGYITLVPNHPSIITPCHHHHPRSRSFLSTQQRTIDPCDKPPDGSLRHLVIEASVWWIENISFIHSLQLQKVSSLKELRERYDCHCSKVQQNNHWQNSVLTLSFSLSVLCVDCEEKKQQQ